MSTGCYVLRSPEEFVSSCRLHKTTHSRALVATSTIAAVSAYSSRRPCRPTSRPPRMPTAVAIAEKEHEEGRRE